MLRLSSWSLLASLLACSAMNREGPSIECDDENRASACMNGIVAECIDGEPRYRVCSDEDVCTAAWQNPAAHRCDSSEELTCGSGMLPCDGSCLDIESSSINCGACNRQCASSQVCDRGVCKCPPDETSCAGMCVDIHSNTANCGSCGNPCSGQCIGGACACPPAQTRCSARCVDTAVDQSNCGACAAGCPYDATCVSGRCQCIGVKNSICAGECVDLSSDEDHCGGCANSCAPIDGTDTGYCLGRQCVKLSTNTSCESAEVVSIASSADLVFTGYIPSSAQEFSCGKGLMRGEGAVYRVVPLRDGTLEAAVETAVRFTVAPRVFFGSSACSTVAPACANTLAVTGGQSAWLYVVRAKDFISPGSSYALTVRLR